jgi:hypothetical protein
MGILMSNLDELDNTCELCGETLGEPSGSLCLCLCSRCFGCGTLYTEADADKHLDSDSGLCKNCTAEGL